MLQISELQLSPRVPVHNTIFHPPNSAPTRPDSTLVITRSPPKPSPTLLTLIQQRGRQRTIPPPLFAHLPHRAHVPHTNKRQRREASSARQALRGVCAVWTSARCAAIGVGEGCSGVGVVWVVGWHGEGSELGQVCAVLVLILILPAERVLGGRCGWEGKV